MTPGRQLGKPVRRIGPAIDKAELLADAQPLDGEKPTYRLDEDRGRQAKLTCGKG